MLKRLRVYSNDFGPEIAEVIIPGDVAAKIVQLATEVKRLGVEHASFFAVLPEFYYHEPDVGPVEVAVENVMLNVRDTDFFWSGFVKHTSHRWETESVTIKDLTDAGVPELSTQTQYAGALALLEKVVKRFPEANPPSEDYDGEINGCEAVDFLSEFIPEVVKLLTNSKKE